MGDRSQSSKAVDLLDMNLLKNMEMTHKMIDESQARLNIQMAQNNSIFNMVKVMASKM